MDNQKRYNDFVNAKVEILPTKTFQKPYFAEKKKEYVFGEQLVLPKMILLETCSWCNLRCEFCPSSKFNRIKELMSDELFEKIIDDLASLDYTGNLQLFYSNEPLLDPKIFDRIKYAASKLKCQLGIFTNAILLTDKILDKLLDAGLTYIMVDIYTSDMHYNNVKEMLQKQADNRKNVKFLFENVTLHNLKTINDDDSVKLFLFDRYVKKVDDKVEDNRTAKINFTTKLETVFHDEKLDSLKNARCIRPLTQMIICFNGKVLVCCEEWTFDPLSVVADLNKNTIHEIWNSEKFNEIRYKLQKDGRTFYPCNCCNYYGGEPVDLFDIKK